jgi:hypothetical protein
MSARSLRGFVRGGVLSALVAGSIGACGGDFDPGSRITSLRVIAVSADNRWDGTSAPSGQSYAKPDEVVHLSALWSVPPDDTRGRSWVWARCVDPESTTVLGCVTALGNELANGPPVDPKSAVGPDAPFLVFSPFHDAPSAVVHIPKDALSRLPEAGRHAATVGILTIVCPGTVNLASLPEVQKGSLPIECHEDGTDRVLPIDEWVVGIKRIFVRETDRNANPEIARVTWDGEEWKDGDVKEVTPCDTDGNRYDRCTDADHHDVALEVTKASYEAGTDEYGVDFTEQLITQYYATEGLFEFDVRVAESPSTAWVARPPARNFPGGIIDMWLVARDNRGGVVWTQRKVHVK